MTRRNGISGRSDLVWTIQDRRDAARGFEQGQFHGFGNGVSRGHVTNLDAGDY